MECTFCILPVERKDASCQQLRCWGVQVGNRISAAVGAGTPGTVSHTIHSAVPEPRCEPFGRKRVFLLTAGIGNGIHSPLVPLCVSSIASALSYDDGMVHSSVWCMSRV